MKKTESLDVKLENVTKKFDNFVAVDQVDLHIEAGNLVTLLGPSGCGKTTILRMVAGLESPTSGKIFIGGEDVTHKYANERSIGMMFQSYALFPHMSVYDNVAYGLKMNKISSSEISDRTNEALKTVGLQGLEHRAPKALSGGQQQRVALARSLVVKPKVLLFDEPLSNLDAKLRKKMRYEIRELQKELGITSLYVTHDQSEALAISDDIVIMNKAIIAAKGNPFTLYQSPANRFVADFIGEANLVEVSIIETKKSSALVELGEIKLDVFFKQKPTGKTAMLMIRPDDIIISEHSKDGMEGTIQFGAYQGVSTDYMVSTSIGTLNIVDFQHKESLLDPGKKVKLNFKTDHLFIIP